MSWCNSKSVLIEVSITDVDLPKYCKSLRESFDNLRLSQCVVPYFLVVLQFRGEEPPSIGDLIGDDVKVIYTRIFSVSNARNIGIDYAQNYGYSHIIFHDSSLVYAPNFLDLVGTAKSACQSALVRGRLTWRKRDLYLKTKNQQPLNEKIRALRVLPFPFIGYYVFPASLIGESRFDISMGPGDRTYPNCGEDVFFLLELYKKMERRETVVVARSNVFHPPRSASLSKQKSYARGQGFLFKMLLTRKSIPFHVYVSFLLFLVNSVRYALFCGSVGRSIFVMRWKGFWGSTLACPH